MVLTHLIIPFVTSYFIILAVVPLVRRYALRWKLGDKPNGRKIHASSIPHLGGIGLTCGVLGGLLVHEILYPGSPVGLVKMFPGMGVIVLLGLVDDIKNLRALQKLSVQLIAALVLVLSGYQLLVGVGAVDGVPVLAALVTMFFIVGVSNSMNLIDGHDGLAAGICLIAASAFFLMAAGEGQGAVMVTAVVLAGACLAFLIFNFPPAKIFMGDTGSMFLGISLAVAACMLTSKEASLSRLAGIGLVLGLPLMDTTLAVTRRVLRRVPIFQADCLHIHHVLSSSGFSDRAALFILYGLQFVLAVSGVLAARGYSLFLAVGLVVLGVSFSIFLRLMLASAESAKVIPH